MLRTTVFLSSFMFISGTAVGEAFFQVGGLQESTVTPSIETYMNNKAKVLVGVKCDNALQFMVDSTTARTQIGFNILFNQVVSSWKNVAQKQASTAPIYLETHSQGKNLSWLLAAVGSTRVFSFLESKSNKAYLYTCEVKI